MTCGVGGWAGKMRGERVTWKGWEGYGEGRGTFADKLVGACSCGICGGLRM